MDEQFIELKKILIALLLQVDEKPKMNNYLLQIRTILDSFENKI